MKFERPVVFICIVCIGFLISTASLAASAGSEECPYKSFSAVKWIPSYMHHWAFASELEKECGADFQLNFIKKYTVLTEELSKDVTLEDKREEAVDSFYDVETPFGSYIFCGTKADGDTEFLGGFELPIPHSDATTSIVMYYILPGCRGNAMESVLLENIQRITKSLIGGTYIVPVWNASCQKFEPTSLDGLDEKYGSKIESLGVCCPC